MGQREMVLDGLAWAGMPEQARVAKLAAKLVRQSGAPNHTQAHVKEVIRNTAPPYGRAKYIFEKVYGKKVKTDDGEIVVGSELNRQYAIFAERRNKHNEWAEWLAFRAEHSTRLNYAYASTFSRPVYELHRSAPPRFSGHGAWATSILPRSGWRPGRSRRKSETRGTFASD